MNIFKSAIEPEIVFHNTSSTVFEDDKIGQRYKNAVSSKHTSIAQYYDTLFIIQN